MAKVLTKRNAAKPPTTRFEERRDHKVAHRLSGKFMKVSVGTGGNWRGKRVRVRWNLKTWDPCIYLVLPIHPRPADRVIEIKRHAGGPWGRDWPAGAAS